MTTRTPDPTAPARRRNRSLVILDITAGIVIALVGLVFAYGIVVTTLSIANQYKVDNTSLLATITTLMIAFAIFGWAITGGMFIVRAIQRRYAFFWPIIGIIIIVLSYYLGALIVGPLGVDA